MPCIPYALILQFISVMLNYYAAASRVFLHQTSRVHFIPLDKMGLINAKNAISLKQLSQTLLSKIYLNVPFHFRGLLFLLLVISLIKCHPLFMITIHPPSCDPHYVLFLIRLWPLYTFVFVCTCVVHNVAPSLDKLSIQSLKCSLEGYTRSQKGYSSSLRR